MKIDKLQVTTKKKRDYIKLSFGKVEVSKEKQMFDARFTKQSDQPMSRALSDALDKLAPHLLYATELCTTEIILDEKLDARKWFDEFQFNEEERFQGLKITGVEFIGNNDVVDSVKLSGYRETQLTEKGFKVPLETQVINLDRTAETHYALVVILEEQIEALHEALIGWLEKGETLSKAQQEMFETVKA